MKDYHIHLTLSDLITMDSYKGMMEGLGNYLGEGYVIVLYSMEDMEHSVVKVINGSHAGHGEGTAVTDPLLRLMEEAENGGKDFITRFTRNKDGDPLKTAAILVRGEVGRIIGLLCIDFYLNTGLPQILSGDAPEISANSLSGSGVFAENLDELIMERIREARSAVMDDEDILPSRKNKEIIRSLYRQGLFAIKGTVSKVAGCLGVSRSTVYTHIRNAAAAARLK
ncbi:PAS domain-containing protein [Lachnospiraceae bacterium 54-53]